MGQSSEGTASYGIEHPFGQFRSAALVVSPPNFLLASSLTAVKAEQGNQKSLDAVQALLSNSLNTGVLPFMMEWKTFSFYVNWEVFYNNVLLIFKDVVRI